MDWNKECFYHYTSFESAIKIIASRTLLFSKINRLSNINESCGPTVHYSGLSEHYTHLTKGKSKRYAFDKAVEPVKKEYPSLEYWAAFIMLD